MSPRDHHPRLDGSQLAGVLLETALNGVYWVLLYHTFEAVLARAQARGETIFKPMPITAVVLFFTITGHWLMDFSLAFQAFVPSKEEYCVTHGKPNPAEIVYLTLADPKAVAGSVFYVLTTLLGDAFMIYRLYIVWGKNKWIVIPPVLLWCALAATGSIVSYFFAESGKPSIFEAAGPWITSCFVLTFCCNMYSTLLIALRISISNRQFSRNSVDTGLSKIMEILVESAALYAVFVILSLVTYTLGSNVQFVSVSMTNPIIGIIFCMIVTRAHRHGAASSPSSYNKRSAGVSGGSHLMRPVAVKISTQTEQDNNMYTKSVDFTGATQLESQYQLDYNKEQNSQVV